MAPEDAGRLRAWLQAEADAGREASPSPPAPPASSGKEAEGKPLWVYVKPKIFVWLFLPCKQFALPAGEGPRAERENCSTEVIAEMFACLFQASRDVTGQVFCL